jgi:hypothetical protein
VDPKASRDELENSSPPRTLTSTPRSRKKEVNDCKTGRGNEELKTKNEMDE